MLPVDGNRQVHYVNAGRGHVIDEQEFPQGRARTPDGHRRRLLGLGFMKATDQGRNHVGVHRMIVVAGTVEIGRHDATVIDTVAFTVLTVEGLA